MTSSIVDQFVANSPWKHVPAKRLFASKKDINVGLKETNRLALTMGGVINRALDDTEGLQSSDYSVYQLFDEGDLVFKLIDLENIKTSRVGWVHERGIMSPAYIRLVKQSSAVNSRFYYWYFYALYLNNIFNGLGGGIRQNLTPRELLEVVVPEVDKRHQTAIDRYLDRETARIDKLIAEKQNFINLLKEKRQALISHVVTKGLDPKAKMKDSGIEWIGKVPEHWVVRKLKYTATIQSGIPKGKDLSNRETISVPMLRVANVQDGYLDLDNVHQIEIEPNELDRYSLQYGDVLMNEGGDNDKLGRGAVWREQITPCIHQNHVFAIRTHDVEPEWLELLTRSSYAKYHFFYSSKQSTNLASISSTNIKLTPLVVPPIEEREAIIDYLRTALNKSETLFEEVAKSVELLKEHRTALISAAVTGKIDVRDPQ